MLKKTGELIRRRVAVLLAVLIALSCLPAPAQADEQKTETEPEETITQLAMPRADAELPPVNPEGAGETGSGTCGKNLTWTLEDGTLTISGEGAMDNYQYSNRPWIAYKDSIQTVVIEEGVSYIGNLAFRAFDNVTSITIPDSVTQIGGDVFRECRSLESIKIPDSVTYLGSDAFIDCVNLKSVQISPSTRMGNFMFLRCAGLADDSGRVIINKIFFDYLGGSSEVRVPDGIVEINGGAFQMKNQLTKVTIPNSVERIEWAAFRGTDSLTDIEYLGTKKEWENISISDENAPLLAAKITCTDGVIQTAYSGECGDDLTWTLEGDVLTISGTGMMDDYGWKQSEWTLAPWSQYQSKIRSVVIEEEVESIGNFAFYNCQYLESALLPESLADIGNKAFLNCRSLAMVNLPDGLDAIHDGTFGDCEKLQSIIIPKSVQTIGVEAFINCTALQKPAIDGSITDIGERAFKGCRSMADKDGFVIVNTILFDYFGSNSEVSIPNSVTRVSQNAFANKNNLKTVTVPAGITNIVYGMFMGCENLVSVSLPDTVASIGYGAFYGCKNLRMTVPNSVNTVDEEAFKGCEKMQDEDGFVIVLSTLFDYFGSGPKVDIPDQITCISSSVFLRNETITEVSIPNGVTEIGNNSFRECINLKRVAIPNSVTDIYWSAFYQDYNLSDVYYFGSAEEWNGIEIDRWNECLTSATIHYITSSEIEPLTVEGNSVTALIAPVCDAADRPTAWCAGYDSAGRMLWVKQKSLTANQMNELTFELEDGAVSVKILALTGDFVPLCAPQESGV